MASNEEKLGEGKLLCRVIIEMMGAPKEHIENTLRDYIESLKNDHEIEIVKEDYAPAEKQDKFWSAFVEIEIWIKNIDKMMQFCFNSMPSSMEIIEPSGLRVGSGVFSGLMNDLLARLHDMDMTVKQLRARNTLMDRNSRAIVRNMLILLLKGKGQSLEELSKSTGLPSDFIEPLLKKLADDRVIGAEEGKYVFLAK